MTGPGGFAVTVDATALTFPTFDLVEATTQEAQQSGPTTSVQTFRLPPGSYLFTTVGPGAASFEFTLDSSGAIDFAPSLQFVSGRGTATLTVTGLPLTVDATALTFPTFDLLEAKIGEAQAPRPTTSVQTFRLLPGSYLFATPAPGAASFGFTLDPSGAIDPDESATGFVSVRGSATLTVTGLALTVDATALTFPTFDLVEAKTGEAQVSRPTTSVQTFRLLPGSYLFATPAPGAASFGFTLDPSRGIDFDANSFVSGRGTTALTVTGLALTVDATALTIPTFDLVEAKTGEAQVSRPTTSVQTFRLLPGSYLFAIPPPFPFTFTLDAAGRIDYPPSVDSFVSGRGTATVRVGVVATTDIAALAIPGARTLSGLPRRDVAYPFRVDPTSQQTAQAAYPAHVAQMVRQLLLTSPGERVDLPQFGCGLRALVFAPMSDGLAATVQLRVLQAVNQWLAGIVTATEVAVVTSAENAALQPGTLQVTLSYTVVETQSSTSTTVILP